MHTHMPQHKSPHSHTACGWLFEPVTFWALLHAHNTTQHNKQVVRPISVFFPSLFLLCPLTVIFFHSFWDWGGGLRGKQGRGEKERLAPANNPLFQHVQLHISKLKQSARKGAYKTLNVLWLNCCVHIIHPPSSAPGACRILCDLQYCSKLKPYITQLIRPWERGPDQSFWG